MNALFVLPVLGSTGEATTAYHMARCLIEQGTMVSFLAAPPASDLLAASFPQQEMYVLSSDVHTNRIQWDDATESIRPDVVVFADYPSLFMSSGSAAFEDMTDWVRSLETITSTLVTLDHCGIAQSPVEIDFGPYHLGLRRERFPSIHKRVQILLPCPLHEPGPLSWRNGTPFRYLEAPTPQGGIRKGTRTSLEVDDDGFIILHPVTSAAAAFARFYRLPYYRYLPILLTKYLGALATRVTLISINSGDLLPQVDGVRVINISAVPPERFDSLFAAADLLVTENAISTTLGRAVVAGLPAVFLRGRYGSGRTDVPLAPGFQHIFEAMRNECPGDVSPFLSFPVDVCSAIRATGLFRGNTILRGLCQVDIYGGSATARRLRGLLTDRRVRNHVAACQRDYVCRTGLLPDPHRALQLAITADSERRV